jgi:hypothetical protein
MKALLLLLAVAGAQPQQFDLQCTFSGRQPKGSPTGEHYRVDLAAGRWCLGACTEVKKVVEATATKIVLENEEAAYRGAPVHQHEINRATGALWRYDRFEIGPPSAGDTFITEGQCQPAPFSGFPEVQTKF